MIDDKIFDTISDIYVENEKIEETTNIINLLGKSKNFMFLNRGSMMDDLLDSVQSQSYKDKEKLVDKIMNLILTSRHKCLPEINSSIFNDCLNNSINLKFTMGTGKHGCECKDNPFGECVYESVSDTDLEECVFCNPPIPF